jgi:Magnesium chelatase, subunit ChlI/Subunit ChlI of Mg-chelatase
MALARTHSVALVGVAGHLIEVEADIAQGLPMTILVGLPDTALREARDRIRAAIVNSAEKWPQSKITVGLSPASLPKRGSGFDLAIAIAILAASQALPLSSPHGIMFFAELGLDGRLRPVPGVLPAVIAATAEGLSTVVVAAENAGEARLVPDARVIAAGSLAQVAMWLRGGPAPVPPPPPPDPPDAPDGTPGPRARHMDLAEVLGQAEARKAVEICAAGGHNLSLLGPPGAGKTMLAERLPTILPGLEPAAALEVTSIHSVAGTLRPGAGLLTEPPFCAPHHTASKAAIVGGGSGIIRPGAASLAHRGVLFLDEASELLRIHSVNSLSVVECLWKAFLQVRSKFGSCRMLAGGPYVQSGRPQQPDWPRLSEIGPMLNCVFGSLAYMAGRLILGRPRSSGRVLPSFGKGRCGMSTTLKGGPAGLQRPGACACGRVLVQEPVGAPLARRATGRAGSLGAAGPQRAQTGDGRAAGRTAHGQRSPVPGSHHRAHVERGQDGHLSRSGQA